MIYMEYAKDSQEKPLANDLSRDDNAEDKNLWSSYKMWRYKPRNENINEKITESESIEWRTKT